MKVVSLFAGCGGLDLGFERAGFEVVWANEYDTTIHATYRLNHPNTELNTSDIRRLSAQDIPDCDGIIGGPPCQSWSLGGRSLGIEDERGRLVYDYIRIVSEKKPKFFVMENVPGMVTPRHLKAFNQFLDLFRDAGYRIRYELMNAADFKIPQERLRVIVVGIRKDLDVEYFFPVKIEHAPITLSAAIGDLNAPPVPYYDEQVEPQRSAIPNHDYYIGPFDQKFMARNRVRGWNELSFTIQAQAKNEPLHPQAPKMEYASADRRKFVAGREHLYRRLSVRECARIQTFPDSFKFIYSNIQDGYKMVGNAVPPRLAYHIALSVDKCFAALLPLAKKRSLALVGYVKSESDFTVIRNKGVYYVRGGNRPGAIQYGQLCKPIKWLVLHRNGKKGLYELLSGNAERCNREDLMRIGFKPRGDEYWMFRIKCEAKAPDLISSVLGQVKTLRPYPQFLIVEK